MTLTSHFLFPRSKPVNHYCLVNIKRNLRERVQTIRR